MSRVKTPSYLQMEAVECGAAALGAVLGYHRRWEPLEELRALCGVSRDGSNAANILAAARRFGFEARGFRKEIPSLRDIPLPAILHWDLNHFVVLEGFSRNKVYINDPASGRRTLPLETLDRSFTGVVLTFDRTEAFTSAGRPFSASRSLATRLQRSYSALGFAVAAGLAATVPGIALSILLTVFVDVVLVQGHSSWATTIVLGVVAVGLVQLLVTYLQSEVLVRLASKLSITWTTGVLWHVLRLPLRFFLQRQPGDVAQRISAAPRLAQLTANQGVMSAINTVSALVFLVVMARVDVVLAAVVLAFGLLSVGVARLVYERNTATNQQLLAEVGRLHAVAVSGLFDIETLKASGREGDFFGRWAGHHARVLNATASYALRGVVLAGTPTLVTAMSTAAVLVIGGLRVIDDTLTFGQLFAFQSLALSFNGPFQRLVTLTTQLQQAEGQMKRIDDVMRHDLDPATTRPPGEADAPLAGSLTLDHVTFGYSPLAEPVLRDVTIHLEPGSRVAIVGATGSGKSTVAKLVCGLYEPWKGQILFDGRPRNTLAADTLADGLALVDQEVLLFAGSVRDNLSLWDPTVTDDRLVTAARDACIHDDIARRPNAYAALMDENGRNFSGGQRQRLEIARALVTDPAVLVLDEATSALDSETELRIDAALRRRGATCLIVAHRLSTIRDCDEIIVLERGEIVERGTHDDLLAAGGAYARLAGSVA